MDNSLFKKLPLELRLEIYERVLHVEGPLRVDLNDDSDEPASQQDNLLAIRATCKEIYHETDGILLAVNNSVTFVHPNDDSTAWGKRARAWCENAGAKGLSRVKSVQFDLGTWDIKRALRGAKDAPFEAIAMFQQLPTVLKQLSVEHSVNLTIDWTPGMELIDGSREMIGPCVLVVPMWKAWQVMRDAIEAPVEEQRNKMKALGRGWRDSWAFGTADLPAFTSPPEYHREGPKLFRQFSDLDLSADGLRLWFGVRANQYAWNPQNFWEASD